jgi:hypothetical protein
MIITFLADGLLVGSQVNPVNYLITPTYLKITDASQNVVLIKRFVSNLIFNLPKSLQT